MSIVKLAVVESQRKTGLAGFNQRHPILTAGIALTGGLAASDAGLSAYKAIKAGGAGKLGAGLKEITANSGLRKEVGKQALHGAGEGALYGGILSTVEPAIAHGVFKKPKEE